MHDDAMTVEFGRAGLTTRIDHFFVEHGLGVNAHLLRRERLPDILALEALSDADLALIGLDRAAILPFVFGDLLAH